VSVFHAAKFHSAMYAPTGARRVRRRDGRRLTDQSIKLITHRCSEGNIRNEYARMTGTAGSRIKAKASLVLAAIFRATVHFAWLDRLELARLASDLTELSIRGHRLLPFRAVSCATRACFSELAAAPFSILPPQKIFVCPLTAVDRLPRISPHMGVTVPLFPRFSG